MAPGVGDCSKMEEVNEEPANVDQPLDHLDDDLRLQAPDPAGERPKEGEGGSGADAPRKALYF